MQRTAFEKNTVANRDQILKKNVPISNGKRTRAKPFSDHVHTQANKSLIYREQVKAFNIVSSTIFSYVCREFYNTSI